jgi:hypothetical protein
LSELAADFAAHGKTAIQRCREEKPDVYVRVVASLQPKEIEVREKALADMTDGEVFEALAEVRALRDRLGEESAAQGKPRKHLN